MAVNRVAALTGGRQDLSGALSGAAPDLVGLISVTETYEAILKEIGPSDNHYGPTNLRATSFTIGISVTLDDETIGRGLKSTALDLHFKYDDEAGVKQRVVFGTAAATDFMKWAAIRDVNFQDPRAAGPSTRYQVDARMVFGALADIGAAVKIEADV